MAEAKKQAYVAKIKKFQALKKQKWDPDVEQELAQDLMMVDDAMSTSPEEKHIEQQLRTGKVPGMNVEMDLGRLEAGAHDRKQRQKAELEAKRKAMEGKIKKAKAFAQEQKDIQAQIDKYEKLAVPQQLSDRLSEAEKAFEKASKEEADSKKSEHMQSFAEEHRVWKPAEEESDYPADAPQMKLPEDDKEGGEEAAAAPAPAPTLGEGDHIIMAKVEVQSSKANVGVKTESADSLEQTPHTLLETRQAIAQAAINERTAITEKVDKKVSDSALKELASTDEILKAAGMH